MLLAVLNFVGNVVVKLLIFLGIGELVVLLGVLDTLLHQLSLLLCLPLFVQLHPLGRGKIRFLLIYCLHSLGLFDRFRDIFDKSDSVTSLELAKSASTFFKL